MLNYLLTQTVLLMKYNQKIYMKSFLSGKIWLTLVTIQKVQSFLMRLIKKLLEKWKIAFGGVILDEFFGLKANIYATEKTDGKEFNTAKVVSIANEFNKFNDVLFNQKIIRHKMKRIQSKKHKWGTYEINKISLSCFDDKRYVLDDEIHTFVSNVWNFLYSFFTKRFYSHKKAQKAPKA